MTEKPTAAELSKFMQGTWRIVSSGSAKAQMPSPGDDIYEYRVAVNGDQMKIILRKGTFAFDGTFRIGALRPDGSAEIDLISREGTWPGLVKIRRSKQKYDPDSFTLNFRWSGSQDRLKDFDDETGGSVSSIAVFRGGREVE